MRLSPAHGNLFGECGRPARSLWPPAKDICKNVGVTPATATGMVALPISN
jgi:hypothetical protein